MRKPFLFFLACIFSVLGTPFFSYAATSSDCQFDTELARLAELKRASIQGVPDAVRAELDLRKSILRKTIICGRTELENRAQELSDLTSRDRAANIIKERYLSRFREFEAYYDGFLGKVDSLGIRGTQDAASQIASWRSNDYTSFLLTLDHFELWYKNQDILGAATDRLNDAERSLVRLHLSDNLQIRNLLNDTRIALRNAEDMNFRAEAELRQFDASGTALPLIKRSLEKLSDAYKIFLDLGSAAEKLLQ